MKYGRELYLFVVIFLPLTILVEVDTDLKLPIPLPPNDVEENEVRPPWPIDPKEVNPVRNKGEKISETSMSGIQCKNPQMSNPIADLSCKQGAGRGNAGVQGTPLNQGARQQAPFTSPPTPYSCWAGPRCISPIMEDPLSIYPPGGTRMAAHSASHRNKVTTADRMADPIRSPSPCNVTTRDKNLNY